MQQGYIVAESGGWAYLAMLRNHFRLCSETTPGGSQWYCLILWGARNEHGLATYRMGALPTAPGKGILKNFNAILSILFLWFSLFA